jgi:ribose transport system substrate-binding protein
VFTQAALAPVNPEKTKFITFDTVEAAPALIRAGKVQVAIGQKYFGWGEESIKLLNDIIHGKNPPQAIIDSGVDVVTADNLEAYLADFKMRESGGKQ